MTDRPSLDSLTGRIIGGRYRLDRLIATGGMAQVWEATDETLARKVAVKLLHPHLAADESFVERFRREAVAAARLSHAAIVSIYDTCSDGDVEAIVMELVHGSTLRDYLNEHGPLEPGQAVAILAEVADALDTAHRGGVVHRDIKPANILLSTDGRVLVADFGIAKAGTDLTATNTTLGTAKYLAPEQVEGGAVDARTDVYALGVVLYEALCGRAPFVADTEAATALARLLPGADATSETCGRASRSHSRTSRCARWRAIRTNGFRRRLRFAPRSSPLDGIPLLRRWCRPTRAGPIRPPRCSRPSRPRIRRRPALRHRAFVRTERGWLVPTLLIILVAAALIVAVVLAQRQAERRHVERRQHGIRRHGRDRIGGGVRSPTGQRAGEQQRRREDRRRRPEHRVADRGLQQPSLRTVEARRRHRARLSTSPLRSTRCRSSRRPTTGRLRSS